MLLTCYNDWANNIPRWILKGNTSHHAFETYEREKLEERPPRLVMGPGAREVGIKISQDEHDKIWEEHFQPPRGKVGRNAPCPCGSGKKYKNCCLTHN